MRDGGISILGDIINLSGQGPKQPEQTWKLSLLPVGGCTRWLHPCLSGRLNWMTPQIPFNLNYLVIYSNKDESEKPQCSSFSRVWWSYYRFLSDNIGISIGISSQESPGTPSLSCKINLGQELSLVIREDLRLGLIPDCESNNIDKGCADHLQIWIFRVANCYYIYGPSDNI